MTATLYLIAHKVRGEPAFDIAIKISDMSRDEDWWIIPTSGHRAYPYWSIPLDRLVDEETIWGSGDMGYLPLDTPPMPADLPDHYPVPAKRASADAIRNYNAQNQAPRPEDL